MPDTYPLGKLPPDDLAALLARWPVTDPRVILGPKPGEDAAVIDIGAAHYLVAKTDPITFTTDELGWYAVHVNANDIAATGGTPQWFMATLLLPGGSADRAMVEAIYGQVQAACASLDISVVGGHTEITYGIDRPIMAGTMFGLVEKTKLVRTSGAQPGDVLLLTKGYPIEAAAIIARERREQLSGRFPAEFLDGCANYLREPGISVVKDARIAVQAGRVHAMHDPTEGGVATGLWEMADASGRQLVVDVAGAVLPDAARLCEAVSIDPAGAIASGALLLAVNPGDARAIAAALEAGGIAAHAVGRVEEGPAAVVTQGGQPLERPARDEIARLFE